MTLDRDDDLHAAERHIVTGLSKIGLALRSMMWAKGQSSGLTPTQGQILALLHQRGALRLSAIAIDLGVRQPTTTEAVNTLVRKGLVAKNADATEQARDCSSVDREGPCRYQERHMARAIIARRAGTGRRRSSGALARAHQGDPGASSQR